MRIGGIDGFPLIIDLQGEEYSRFRLTTHAVGTLHFDQCEVWADAGGTWKNLAASGTASQSSVWREGYGPELGNNGSITGDLGPHTKHEPNASWDVRFGKFIPCNYLVLFNRLRFFAERMVGLCVYGHTRTGWKLLFHQSNATHVTRWGETILDLIDNRLAAQLDAAILPQTSIATDSDKARAIRSSRFYQYLESVKVLRRLVTSLRLINATPAGPGQEDSPELTGMKEAVRTALYATLPMNLTPDIEDAFLFDVSSYEKLLIRTRSTSADRPLAGEDSFDLQFFPYEPAAHLANSSDGAPPAPSELFDYISCRMRTILEVPVTDTGVVLSVNTAEIANVKWEVWGERSDGALSLVYDNTTVSRAIFQLQYLLERGDHAFADLTLGSRALELEGKHSSAWMFSLYFPTTAPETEDLDDYLDQIEYRSFMDLSRRSVSRTKHGYRQTFRFKDKSAFASGIQLVADTLRGAGYHGVPFYGTLLGFLRERSLIDHDDDGDLLMLNDATSKEEMMEYRTALLAWLDDNTSWTIYRGEGLPAKNIAVGFEHDGESIHCDLFPTWVEDDQRMVLHEGRGGFVPLPIELFDADRVLTIEGADFRVPAKSEDLMELVYGDWRKPYRGYMLGFQYQVQAKQMTAATSNGELR